MATAAGLVRVHGKSKRLDAVLAFVSFAARGRPLAELLDVAPGLLADVFEADVVSLYLLEGDGRTLVMRGTIGFSARALGRVRLNVGEGITGRVVELMRPLSIDLAPTHQNYRHFPELEEDRFPVFAAVPIVGKRGALGATTIQRRGPTPFTDSDVELLISLSATISAGVRAAELLDVTRDRVNLPRRSGGGTRKITLGGQPVVKGRALGAVAALRRPPLTPRTEQLPEGDTLIKNAFEAAHRALEQLKNQAKTQGLEDQASFLDTYLQIVSDARMKGEVRRMYREGMGVAQALGEVARAASRAASNEANVFLEERARDIEDLCDALVMLAEADPRAMLPARAVVIADRITVFDILISSKSHPAGIALSEHVSGNRAEVLLKLWGIPALIDVGGLFRWASSGDIALLDADHGLLMLNPTRTEIVSTRKRKKLE
jgi:phosphotransferase system, enzyme I, PtsP